MLLLLCGRIIGPKARCIQFDDSKSGDHLKTVSEKPPAVTANIPERQGVTGIMFDTRFSSDSRPSSSVLSDLPVSSFV
jgi:hypothetical protein